MLFFNSTFRQSTIRPDESIAGAILVDSILIRESELLYGDETNFIPKESISDINFLNSLNGLLVFKEHPRDMVNANNFNQLASEAIGIIVNASYGEMDGDSVVLATLRVSKPEAVDEIANKRIRGGSLGYMANVINENGKKVQKGLIPNHFCITYEPRDKGVYLLNSKGEKMSKDEIVSIVTEILNSKAVENENVIVPKEIFNSFMQVIHSKIEDEEVKKICSSKHGIDKMTFLDSVLSIKNVFNSETIKENEALKEELEELKEAEQKENDDTKNIVENSDEEIKENEDSKEEEAKENEEEVEEKQNSTFVDMPKQEIKNSTNSCNQELNAILNQIL